MPAIDANNQVVQILMKRDKLVLNDAIQQVLDTAAEMLDAIAEGDDPEEILMDNLGLEPDYIFEIIDLY